MAKSSNQKLKILYLRRILLEKTDETHAITMPEIIAGLASYGISAERKSLYDDIESLKCSGLDIISYQENHAFYYKVASRPFELAELKLLVDSVQSAKFITAKKSNELIRKIEGLASRYEASALQRQVYVTERIKTMNESIYYNVDYINDAINENKMLSFQYFQWNADKQPVLKHNGALYKVSPWALSWDDENYYLVAYDSAFGGIKHFRVDKMCWIAILEEKREGEEAFRGFDMAVYAKKIFGMYGGREETVRLECANSLANVIVDRFGKDVMILKKGEDRFTVNVRVAVSRQFLGWVMALGSDAKIVSPQSVIDEMKQEAARLTEQYRSDKT